MSIERSRLWRFHHHRPPEDFCPLCAEPVTWIRDREKDMWCPCNRQPAMYIEDAVGKKVDMYTQFRKPVKGILYNSWDKRFTKDRIRYGFVPHVYTCEVLLNDNKEN